MLGCIPDHQRAVWGREEDQQNGDYVIAEVTSSEGSDHGRVGEERRQDSGTPQIAIFPALTTAWQAQHAQHARHGEDNNPSGYLSPFHINTDRRSIHHLHHVRSNVELSALPKEVSVRRTRSNMEFDHLEAETYFADLTEQENVRAGPNSYTEMGRMSLQSIVLEENESKAAKLTRILGWRVPISFQSDSRRGQSQFMHNASVIGDGNIASSAADLAQAFSLPHSQVNFGLNATTNAQSGVDVSLGNSNAYADASRADNNYIADTYTAFGYGNNGVRAITSPDSHQHEAGNSRIQSLTTENSCVQDQQVHYYGPHVRETEKSTNGFQGTQSRRDQNSDIDVHGTNDLSNIFARPIFPPPPLTGHSSIGRDLIHEMENFALADPIDSSTGRFNRAYGENAHLPIQIHKAKYFVIKVGNTWDLGAARKYCVWSSTIQGNIKLDKHYRGHHSQGPVYLFFSQTASGKYAGVAEMISGVNFDALLGIWSAKNWSGSFRIKWHLKKDVPLRTFAHLKNDKNQSISTLGDMSEISGAIGAEMLRIFYGHRNRTPNWPRQLVQAGAETTAENSQREDPRVTANISTILGAQPNIYHNVGLLGFPYQVQVASGLQHLQTSHLLENIPGDSRGHNINASFHGPYQGHPEFRVGQSLVGYPPPHLLASHLLGHMNQDSLGYDAGLRRSYQGASCDGIGQFFAGNQLSGLQEDHRHGFQGHRPLRRDFQSFWHAEFDNDQAHIGNSYHTDDYSFAGSYPDPNQQSHLQ